VTGSVAGAIIALATPSSKPSAKNSLGNPMVKPWIESLRFCVYPTDLEDLYLRSRTEGFGEEVKRRIMIGTYALSAGYYDAYYLKAQKTNNVVSGDGVF
jgi:Asp-tRNA(Asn)/Glu-tRNA(Gln) amidotransferase A subunit family amidase